MLFPAQAFAISADDFVPPAQAETETQEHELLEVKTPSAVTNEVDPNLEVEVTKAKTLQDSLNDIVEKHKRGCTTAEPSPNGVTFIATGQGTYNPSYKNVLASRIEQRNAYVMAFMDAKSEMAQFVGNLVVRGITNFETRNERISDETKNLRNLERDLSEAQLQTVRKVLKGYVTYSVFDDGNGKVFVSIVSSPKTRGKFKRMGNDGILASSLNEGLNSLISEIKNNLVPPVGGRIITTNDGQVAWVGFGSAIVDKDEEPDVQAELDLDAERTAGTRAVDALAGIIIGDDTVWERKQDEQTLRQIKDFELLQQADQSTKNSDSASEIHEYDQRVRTMRNIVSSSTAVRSLRSGVLPPGIVRHTELDDDGYFAYGIAVYSPAISDKVNEASREMDEAQIVQPLSNGNKERNDASSYGSSQTLSGNREKQELNLQMKRGPSGIVKQDL